jgi:hypothetical protein
MERKRLLEFDEIFNNPMKDTKKYLLGINKRRLIRIASYFLTGFYEDVKFFCTSGKYFSTPNSGFASQLYCYIREKDEQIAIINKHASLYFLEEVLSLPEYESDEFNPNIEIKILQAYLSINQVLVSKENPLITQITNLAEKDKLVGYLFYQPLAYSDFTNYDYSLEVVAQTIKAIHFLKFCKNDLPYHLELFYKKYNCTDWKDYLKSYLSIPYMLTQNKTREISTIAIKKSDNNFDKQILFFDMFAINSHVKQPDYDFTQIRNYPLYKEKDDTYIVLFDLFSAERIYRSLYFDFNEINNSVDKEYRIKSFRSTITDIYSERFILYNVLNKLFSAENFIKLTGSDYKTYDKTIIGEPDYYARKDKNIFLFESKDILLNAEIKTSYDYPKIQNELKKKLYEDKGIKQLCGGIKKILNKELPLDIDYGEQEVNIYSILVLHERIYSNVGLNYIINEWYEESIEKIKSSIVNPKRIKSLIIIDLDTLILLQNLKQGADFDFKDLLDKYINEVTSTKITDSQSIEDIFIRHYFSFKDFVEPIIKKKINKKGLNGILYIQKTIKELFSESEIVDAESRPLEEDEILSNNIKNRIRKKIKHNNNSAKKGKGIITKRKIRKRNRRKYSKR